MILSQGKSSGTQGGISDAINAPRTHISLTSCSYSDIARLVAPRLRAAGLPGFADALDHEDGIKLDGMELSGLVTAELVAASPLGSVAAGDRAKLSLFARQIRLLRRANLLPLLQSEDDDDAQLVTFPTSAPGLRVCAEDPTVALAAIAAERDSKGVGPALHVHKLELGVDLPSGEVPAPDGYIRVVCISDTHGRHEKMTHAIPCGDVLIHAGDFTNTGRMKNTARFCEWFAAMPHPHKILIAGNRKYDFSSL